MTLLECGLFHICMKQDTLTVKAGNIQQEEVSLRGLNPTLSMTPSL